MTTNYDAAVAALYRAPHDDFVSERKRLAQELAAQGDREGAALLAKRARPSVSAWATNQLFWRDRPAFEALFASAARLREGELEAGAEHRKLTARLVARASEILEAASHAASEATLRRVSANLAALAAAGGFEPDPPGALAHDRDPPGFDVLAFGAAVEPKRDAASRGGSRHGDGAEASRHGTRASTRATRRADEHAAADAARRQREEAARARADAARARLEAEAERRRVAEEQARIRAERRRLESALRAIQSDVERHTRERERLKAELTHVDAALERSRLAERDLVERLANLVEPETGEASPR